MQLKVEDFSDTSFKLMLYDIPFFVVALNALYSFSVLFG
jgi:hypothetical protein